MKITILTQIYFSLEHNTQFSRLYRLKLLVGSLGLVAKTPFAWKASFNSISIEF